MLSQRSAWCINIRPLLRLSRKTIVRCQKTEYALVSSLERDPLLAEKIKRLRTVPGVGPITAPTWALDPGQVLKVVATDRGSVAERQRPDQCLRNLVAGVLALRQWFGLWG
jgi:hypothetical protein